MNLSVPIICSLLETTTANLPNLQSVYNPQCLPSCRLTQTSQAGRASSTPHVLVLLLDSDAQTIVAGSSCPSPGTRCPQVCAQTRVHVSENCCAHFTGLMAERGVSMRGLRWTPPLRVRDRWHSFLHVLLVTCFCTECHAATTALSPPDFGSIPDDPCNTSAGQSLIQGYFVLGPARPWTL